MPSAPYSKPLLIPFSLYMDRDRYAFVSSPKDYGSNGFCRSFSRFTHHIRSGAGRRYTCDGEFWRLRALEEITRLHSENSEAIQSNVNRGLRSKPLSGIDAVEGEGHAFPLLPEDSPSRTSMLTWECAPFPPRKRRPNLSPYCKESHCATHSNSRQEPDAWAQVSSNHWFSHT